MTEHPFSNEHATVTVLDHDGGLFLSIETESAVVDASVIWNITDYSLEDLKEELAEPTIDFPYDEGEDIDADKFIAFTTGSIREPLDNALAFIESNGLLK